MIDLAPISEEAMAALRLLTAPTPEPLVDDAIISELLSRGFIRQNDETWSINIEGHMHLIGDIMRTF